MSVEILLASYQGAKYIEDQIESILDQTFRDFKLIIRDDSSSDETLVILQKLASQDSRIVVHSGDKTLGVRGSFETLMQLSSADYLFFSDQDDIWHSEKLEIMLTEMKRQETLHGKKMPLLIHSDLTVVDHELKTIASSFWSHSKLSPYKASKLSHLLLQNPVTGCSALINRALLKKSLPIHCKAVLHDHWIALVAASFGKRITLSLSLVEYRQHPNNVLGASAFNEASYIISGINKVFGAKTSLKPLFDQAQAFHDQFESELGPDDKAALQAFLSLPKKNFWQARVLLLKHALYKQGALRNLGLFFTSFKR